MAAVPAGQVAAVQPAPAARHGDARGHGVVDGVPDRRGRAHRVPGRLVRPGQLLDPVRVLARLGGAAVRPEHLVQPHALRHLPGAPGPGVRRRRRRPGRRRRRARVPAVRAPLQIAYGRRHRRFVVVVRLFARRRTSASRTPHDRHRHTAVHRRPDQRHAAAGRAQQVRRRGPVMGRRRRWGDGAVRGGGGGPRRPLPR